jgi:hypothetical protein
MFGVAVGKEAELSFFVILFVFLHHHIYFISVLTSIGKYIEISPQAPPRRPRTTRPPPDPAQLRSVCCIACLLPSATTES